MRDIDGRSTLPGIDETGRRLATELGFAKRGQYFLVVRGFDADPRRALPTITVVTV